MRWSCTRNFHEPSEALQVSRSREGVSEIVKQDGANVSSSASKKTSYTVVGIQC